MKSMTRGKSGVGLGRIEHEFGRTDEAKPKPRPCSEPMNKMEKVGELCRSPMRPCVGERVA